MVSHKSSFFFILFSLFSSVFCLTYSFFFFFLISGAIEAFYCISFTISFSSRISMQFFYFIIPISDEVPILSMYCFPDYVVYLWLSWNKFESAFIYTQMVQFNGYCWLNIRDQNKCSRRHRNIWVTPLLEKTQRTDKYELFS